MKKMRNDAELKEKYYRDLEAMHEQYDIFLHDIKHMMRTILALAGEGNCGEIERLVKEMGVSLGTIEQTLICSHNLLNALLSERKGNASDRGVTLELDVKEPLYLQSIEDMDLITLVGNLLDNAIEAEAHAAKREGVTCSIAMARGERHIIFQIENSYESRRADIAGTADTKAQIGDKHGIGLNSARKVIEKYGGIMEAGGKAGRYHVKVIMPA